MELDKLSIGKISEITNSEPQKFKEKVKELNPTVKDLKALKEAESSGQDREKLLQFLNDQLTSEKISNYLGIADQNINNLEGLISQIEEVEDIQHFEEKNIEIEQNDLLDLLGGTIQEMKEFVEENQLTSEQLQNVLEAEKRVKNRKTAIKYLEKQIEKQKIGQDVEKAMKDLDNLEEDIEKIREDKETTENVEHREEDSDKDEEKEENDNSTEEELDKVEDELEEQEKEEEEEEEKETEESSEEDTDDNKTDLEDENTQEESEEKGDSSEEESKFEKKKKLAEELELEMSDEELQNISLDHLQNIKEEKEHRQNLIKKLKKHGMNEEDLKNSSTSDLEKIADSMDDKSESPDSQEEHEEMREEAEEDLEMLMGAVRTDEESEGVSNKDAREKIEDFTESIKEKLHRSEEEDEEKSKGGINAENVQEVLDQYRELESEEASVKTAHIMKGFLEQKLGLEREMTYKELADKMPVEEDESIDKLADFFIKMHREQYTGKFNVDNPEEIIDTCNDVIKKLG